MRSIKCCQVCGSFLALVGGARLRFKISSDGVTAQVRISKTRECTSAGVELWRALASFLCGCQNEVELAVCKSLASIFHSFASEFFDQCAARACDSDWRN